MLSQFLQYLFSGMTVGATYALAALGFTLIYNASNVINFAQGEFIMLGGMLTVLFIQGGLPLPLAIALAIRLVPPAVLAECRERAEATLAQASRLGRIAAAVVLLVWLALAVVAGWLAWRYFGPAEIAR